MFLNLHLFQNVYKHNRPPQVRFSGDKAAKLGYLAHIKTPYVKLEYKDAMDYAAMYGHLEVVIWLHENRTEGCTTFAMNTAAARNHMEVVQWLYMNRSEGCTLIAIELAVKRGHLEMVKFLYKNLYTDTESDILRYCMTGATIFGHLPILQWVYSINPRNKYINYCLHDAIKYDHLDIVQWLNDIISN